VWLQEERRIVRKVNTYQFHSAKSVPTGIAYQHLSKDGDHAVKVSPDIITTYFALKSFLWWVPLDMGAENRGRRKG